MCISTKSERTFCVSLCKHQFQSILYTVAMSRKPQKFCVSKPTIHKTDKTEHDLGKRISATCLVKIVHYSVTSAAKQVGVPSNTLFKIRKKAVEHIQDGIDD